MAINLILTENYLKENSIIRGNVDMQLITPTIVNVQQMYMEDLLGTKLYNQILSQIGSSSVSTANQTLLDDYVIPCMIEYIKSEMTPVLQFQYMNIGVVEKTSEHTQTIDLEKILFLMDKWRNNAEKLAEKVTKFLKKNSTTYPLYLDNTEIDEIKPLSTNFFGGLYLDDNGDEDCCDNNEDQ